MAGRHRAPHDLDANRLQREAMKPQRNAKRRERAARVLGPANWWLIRFSTTALVFTAVCSVFFVWSEGWGVMWIVGLQSLIH
ncbi:hypothetical protein [Nocardiopsis sp. NPDC058789]|uniref:hypothetical protein n=1 Tax=Nocardiopsis sp. NPDC058789 TaxID=3346634 RepID=UPI0036711842